MIIPVPAAPGRYRIRNEILIDAIEWTGSNAEAVREFAGGHWDASMPPCFVARGVTGYLFTVDAEKFAETYEPAPSGDDPAERLLALQLPVEVLGVATLREHLTAGIAADVYLLAAQRDQAREVVAEILDMLGQDGHPDSLMVTEWRQRAGLEPSP
jgi:hypothetical protein